MFVDCAGSVGGFAQQPDADAGGCDLRYGVWGNDYQFADNGAANATLFTGNDLGIGLGVMLLGMVAEAWGYRDMYLFTAFPLLAALIFYVFFVRGHRLKLKEA